MASDKSALEGLRIDRGAEAADGGRGAGCWIALARGRSWSVAGGLLAWLGRRAPSQVRVAAAVRGAGGAAAGAVLNASGYVTARRQATVSSKVTGKVIEVLVEEGMVVERGAGPGPPRRLDRRAAQLALAEAQLGSPRQRARRDRGAPARGRAQPAARAPSSREQGVVHAGRARRRRGRGRLAARPASTSAARR